MKAGAMKGNPRLGESRALCKTCEMPFVPSKDGTRHPVLPNSCGLPDRDALEYRCPHCGEWNGAGALLVHSPTNRELARMERRR